MIKADVVCGKCGKVFRLELSRRYSYGWKWYEATELPAHDCKRDMPLPNVQVTKDGKVLVKWS